MLPSPAFLVQNPLVVAVPSRIDKQHALQELHYCARVHHLLARNHHTNHLQAITTILSGRDRSSDPCNWP